HVQGVEAVGSSGGSRHRASKLSHRPDFSRLSPVFVSARTSGWDRYSSSMAVSRDGKWIPANSQLPFLHPHIDCRPPSMPQSVLSLHRMPAAHALHPRLDLLAHLAGAVDPQYRRLVA